MRFSNAELENPDSLVGLTTLVFVLFAAAASFADAGAASSTTGPAHMVPQDICAVLAWRESKLKNCSFAFTETRILFQQGVATDTLLATDKISVKYKNGAVWMDVNETNAVTPALNVVHSLQLWDGNKCTCLDKGNAAGNGADPAASITQSEPHVLYLTQCFSVLGMRQARISKPWSTWIGSMLAAKGTIAKITDGTEGGESIVRLVLTPGSGPHNQFSFTFLPEKDYVTRDFELTLRHGSNEGKVAESWHVDQFKKFGGFWMPSVVSYTNGLPKEGNRGKITLGSFSLKAPDDADMQIKFPPGTKVLDATKMEFYTILPNGKRRYESFYDNDTGKVIDPPAEATTTQPAATRP